MFSSIATIFVFISGGACSIALRADTRAVEADEKAVGNTASIEKHVGVDDQRYNDLIHRIDRLQDTLDRKHP